MISDTLSRAVQEINDYLLNAQIIYPSHEPLTKRIIQCRNEMEAIRIVLDSPPDSTPR